MSYALHGYDQWLTREPPEPRPREGDEEDHGEIVRVAPCATCGLLCAVVERVVAVWSFDGPDEWHSKGGMRLDEEKRLDEERTMVSNPDAPASEWVCCVCAGFCDESDITRPEAP